MKLKIMSPWLQKGQPGHLSELSPIQSGSQAQAIQKLVTHWFELL